MKRPIGVALLTAFLSLTKASLYAQTVSITGLNPSSAAAGGPGFTLTVNGANFTVASVVKWNGSGRATTFVNPAQLAAAIPGGDIAAAGTSSVTVSDPLRGTSAPAAFTIYNANPVPTISSLSPNSANARSPDFTLSVTGSNFMNGSVVRWNGAGRATTFVSNTTLTAMIPSSDVASPGSAGVTVSNPAPGGGTSAPSTFTIVNPPPACASPANAIVAENCQPGNPASDWDIPLSTTGSPNAGDPALQGFATDISYNKGDTVGFKIRTDAASYQITIYRMGYYGGLGARQVAALSPLPQPLQPACLSDAATGLIDCGNWSTSAAWTIPSNAVSGIYFAKLFRPDTGGTSHIVFIVRDDAGASKLLFQTSDTTWQAYNNWGGNSLYIGSPAGRAYKVSYNRPFASRDYSDNQVFTHEYPMVRFLEANGYDISYFTDVDGDRRGALIKNHKVFLSVGHDEYWSGGQRANVEAARAAGVHLAFFSGGSLEWKTRWENSIDLSGTPYRTLVCYKETYGGTPIDPLDPPTFTGLWRDGTTSPSADGGRPQNGLIGTMYSVDSYRQDPMTVSDAEGKLRLWRQTSVATLAPGTSASFPNVVGYEWDEDFDNGFRPAGLIQLSSITIQVPQRQVGPNYGYVPGAATHHLTLYRHPSGALVFSAASMQWSWGLDSSHDMGYQTPTDPPIQQATVNLLADMGVQAAALMPSLSPASPSTDTVPPVSKITSPAPGASFPAGTAIVISGTASDVGGAVGGVEVSVDSGTSWHPAAGRSNWSFAWTPAAAGVYAIKSRAADDSGNIESPSAGITATFVGAAPLLSGISPSSAPAGSPGVTLTLAGSNFTPNSSVLWNGTGRPTSFVSASQLTAAIPSSDLVSAGTATVAVYNPGPGGGTTAPQTFTILLMPSISNLSPNSATAGGPGFTLTVAGNNFSGGSVVQWNGAQRATTFVSGTALTAAIPASDIVAPGTANVAVFNSGGQGGTSAPASFTISPVPGPAIAQLSPSSAAAGGPAFTLTVSGSGFASVDTLRWNGTDLATTYVSSATLTAAVPAGDIASGMVAGVTVFVPGPGGGSSAPSPFTVYYPAPSVASITPSSAPAGSSAFILTVNGANFTSTSTVQWNGAGRATSFVSSATLTAAIPASDVSLPGSAGVAVFTPGPGGGTSASSTFTVTLPAASISSLSPNSAVPGGPGFTMTVRGSNFVPGAAVLWNGAGRSTTYVSTSTLTAAIPASDIVSSGTAQVAVSVPGGPASAPALFTISDVNPVPSITSLSPGSAAAGGPSFTLTVMGTNFIPSSRIRWNGEERLTIYASSAALTTNLSAADVAQPGAGRVTVFNPGPGGGSSNGQDFAILAAPGADLRKPRVFPNPLHGAGAGSVLNFGNIPGDSQIRIFTQAGRLVRTITAHGGAAAWDLANEAREPVVTGIYLYVITDGDGKTARGLAAVIR